MPKKVLFVDDEQKVLEGIKRNLYGKNFDCEIKFAISAEEALKILNDNTIDVVISDLKMPGKNGIQLLNVVREEYPEIIRIILSGHSDQKFILKSLEVAHQYLVKPFSTDALVSAVKKACEFKNILRNDKIKKIIIQAASLPSAPSLYREVAAELEAPEYSVDKISSIISRDIGMTSKILQLVNSAYFGLNRKISDINEAIIILGIDVIKSLTLTLGVFSEFKESSNPYFSIDKLLDKCVTCGNYSKIIARLEKADTTLMSNSFASGLLHGIGELLIATNLPEKYNEIIMKIYEHKVPFIDAENSALDVSIAEVGGYLLQLWGLSSDVINAVSFFSNPLKSTVLEFSPLTCVHSAVSIYFKKYSDKSFLFENFIDGEYLKKTGKFERFPVWEEACSENIK